MKSKIYIFLEARVLYEVLLFFLKLFSFEKENKKKSQPILVLPGLGAGDFYMWGLRKILTRKGFPAYGWGLGINRAESNFIEPNLQKKLDEIFEKHKKKVTLVGWSMGGHYARELYRKNPDKVKMIFALGSPLKIKRGSNIDWAYRLVSSKPFKNLKKEINEASSKIPPDAPIFALYSKTDGFTPSNFCYKKEFKSIQYYEVGGSHLGLPFNSKAINIIIKGLSAF